MLRSRNGIHPQNVILPCNPAKTVLLCVGKFRQDRKGAEGVGISHVFSAFVYTLPETKPSALFVR